MHSQAVEHTEGHAPIDIDVAGENKCSYIEYLQNASKFSLRVSNKNVSFFISNIDVIPPLCWTLHYLKL